MTNALLINSTGISGSLTNLADGTSYLIAGPNVSIASGSNGSVTISASTGSFARDTVIVKTVDQVVAGTTLTNDTDLFVNAPANSVWSLTWYLFTTTIIHNESIWSLTVPSGASFFFGLQAGSPAAAFSPTFGLTTTSGSPIQVGGPAGESFTVNAQATVFMGSTSGSINLQYAEWANSSGLRVYQGSQMRATRIS